MQKLLELRNESKEYIKKYYQHAEKEKNIIIYLQKQNNQYVDAELLVPQIENYVHIKRKSVSLNPEYLLWCINKCISNKYDGILIMHNHVKQILPIFSKKDRIMNKKFIHFFDKYNINLIAGSIVYANSMITVKSNNKKINKNIFLSRI